MEDAVAVTETGDDKDVGEGWADVTEVGEECLSEVADA